MANGNQIKFGVGYEVDKSSIQKVKQSLRQLQNIKIGDFKGTEQELQNIQKTAKAVESALQQAFNPTLNTTNIQTFNSVLQQSKRTLDTVYTDFAKLGSQGRQAFTQVASQIMTTNTQLRQTKTLLTSMGQTMINTVKWGVASSVMNSFTNSIRQSIEYVKNLDSALTDIRIVTGDSTERMKEFAVQANQAAQALGRSTMDYSKAALTFYQQGLSDEDVQARTQATLKAQNITGAGDEMADYLTAVWNGYKVANEEAELYVDKLAAVADSSASNMAQLATAMSKVASTANMLGVPVDKLNAQIATITATTRQAPETVGNALKTIYARINDIATGADDAQISLGNYSSKMAEVGFSVLDASGHLRDTGDVIDEIGAKWGTLSREQQIYLARTMAGQRQYNNLLALFENWGRYTDLVTVSMESQGATIEKNERYLDSLAAKTEQFGAAQERVKSALINENDLKGIVDFGTKATNLFASLIEGIGGGRKALLAFGSIATSIFGNVIGKQIGNMIVKSQQAKASFQAMSEAIANTRVMQVSTGAQDPNNAVFKQYINNLQEVQGIWSVLTTQEKQEQQQRAKNIALWKQQREEVIENQQAALELAQVFSANATIENNFSGAQQRLRGLNQTLQEGQRIFQQYWQSGQTNYEALARNIQTIQNRLNQPLPAFFKDLQAAIDGTLNDTDALDTNIEQFYSNLSKNVNAAINISESNKELSQLDSKIKITEDDFKRLNQEASVVFDSQRVVKFTSSLTQIGTLIGSIINLTKTWKNENISLGQKLTQIFTTIGFMVPMLVSAYKNITESLGLQQLGQAKKTLELQKQLLLIKQQKIEEDKIRAEKDLDRAKAAKERAKQQVENWTPGLGGDFSEYDDAIEKAEDHVRQLEKAENQCKDALGNVGNEASKLPSTFGKIKETALGAFSKVIGFLSGPGGLVVLAGIAAVAIGTTLYKAWNKASEAAKKATQQMQVANNIYKDSKDTLEDLKSSLESLKDAQNNLSELTTGTEEWKSALEDVNNQVIELLEKFPQLAQYVSTNANGMLQISEEGQQYVLNQQRQASQANAMGYISSRQRSDAANRQNEITQASRNWGMGAWDTSVLDNVVTAIQEQGSSILNNTKELQELTGASSKQIEAIDKHKSEIIALAEKLTANTVATNSLTQSIITGTFIDPQAIAKSSNADIFTAEIVKAVENATLDYSKYGTKKSEELKQLTGNQDDYYLDPNKIIERYKEINQDIADEISMSGGKVVRTVKGTKEKIQLNFDDIVKAVAAADAATTEGMKHIIDNAEQITQQYVNKFGESASTIYKIGQGAQAAGEVSEEELLGFISNKDVLDALHQQTGKDIDVIIQDIAHLANQTRRGIKNYIDSLPEQIGQDLKDLSDVDNNNIADISEAAQKVIGQSLQNAWKNGTYDQYLDVLKDLNPQDMEGFTTFIDGLGEEINSIDVNTFRDKLEELGISSKEVSDQKIQQLIDKLRELNGINLQEGLGQLYEGTTSFLEKYAKDSNATLNKKEFESLSQIASGLDIDLSQFFEQTWKGTYKLKTSAEEFFDYINNQSLNNFEEAFSAATEKISQLTLAQNFKDTSGYSSKDLTYWSGTSGIQGDTARIAAAEFLQGLGDTDEYLEDIIQGKEISEDRIKDLQEQLSLVADKWDNIGEEVNNATNNLSILASQQQQIINAQEEMRQQMREMQLDDEVDADKWKDLSKYVHQYGTQINKTGKASERVSKDVEENIEIAEDLAEAILRYSSALQEVTDNYETWKAQLESGSAQAAAQAANELADVYADLLDLPFEQSLTPNFTNDIQNLQLLKQATQGSEQAYNRLLEKAGQDILLQVGLDTTQFYSDKAAIEAEIENFTGQDFGDIQIGAALNDEAFLQSLTDIVNNAHMTAQQATNYLASMGIDAQVKEQDNTAEEEQQIAGYHAVPTTVPIHVQRLRPRPDGKGYITDLLTETFSSVKYQPDYTSVKGKKENKSFALKVTSAHKSSGGNFKFTQTQHNAPTSKSSGGGGGGKGGGGSTKQPSIAKLSTESISTKQKESFVNPYEAVEKSYDRQEDQLKKLDNLQKKLVGKDRLNNLNKQNKELEKQNKIIEQRQKISRDAATEGTTANLRNQISADAVLEQVARFNSDGQLNETASKNAAVNAYNAILNQQKADFDQKVKEYNNWIENVWNKYSGQQQEANKREKELRDDRLKDDKKHAEQAIKIAEEEYNDRIKLIDNYKKALEEDQKYYEQYLENIRKIIENKIAQSKIKVDLSLDFGELERDFLDFRNKVVRKIADDDILGNTKAIRDELKSYYDSKELNNLAERIKSINKEIATIQAGGYSSIYGISRESFDMLKLEDRQALQKEYLKQAKEDLEAYTKQYMESLEQIQELRDDIYENYLDSIDDVKDKMDQVIDQYDRINDLVQHRIKLTELLYGDNSGFSVLDKYYDKQYKNNLKQLETLKKQQQYWRNQMEGVEIGSDAWKKFKENLENIIDQINAALENQLDLIATKFQNKIQQAIKNITTSLSKGLGNDYLEQEWDYISKDDDAFLDVVNSKFGIDEVERLYTEAMTGTADQQRKINNLMNAQLKILREKDKLTQYDIDRAKAALEVEKARMALEDSRNQKTKMRLRRDSQGNYTYQYVQDEQKLTDLQTALANAQADLYNMDKEHYQQQLNQMYSTYKDYIQKMSQLERQYAATTDAFEKSRLQKQMDLLRDKYSEYFDNINEDLQYNLTQYLPESYADAMGLSLQNYSLPEQVEILKENLPYTNSQMQALSEEIERQGGIVMATKDYYKELTDAAKEAAAAQIEALSVVGSSIEDISSGEDSVGLTETKEYIQYYEDTVSAAKNVTTEVNNLLTSIDKFLGTDFDQNGFIPMLQKSYELLQNINNLEGTNAGKIFNMLTVDQTVDKQVINKNALTDKLQTNFNNASSDYLKNLSSALDMAQAIKLAQDLTESQKAGYLNSLNQYQLGMADDINKMNLINKEALQQSVHIEAMFPNVQNHNEIEEAIEILIGKASQKAAG